MVETTSPAYSENPDARIRRKILAIEPAKMLKDVPELRELCQEIRDSRETEFEKKARLTDLTQVLSGLLEDIEVVDTDDPGNTLYPLAERYLGAPWIWCRWLTARFLSRYLDYHLAAQDIKANELQKQRKRASLQHYAEIAVIGLIVALAAVAVQYGLAQQMTWITIVASVAVVVSLSKLTDIVWERHRMNQDTEAALRTRTAFATLLAQTQRELDEGYFSMRVIEQRLLKLETNGVYMNSFIFYMINKTLARPDDANSHHR